MLKPKKSDLTDLEFEVRAKREICHWWNVNTADMLRRFGELTPQKLDTIFSIHVGDSWKGQFRAHWYSLLKPIPYLFEVEYLPETHDLALRVYEEKFSKYTGYEVKRPSGIWGRNDDYMSMSEKGPVDGTDE